MHEPGTNGRGCESTSPLSTELADAGIPAFDGLGSGVVRAAHAGHGHQVLDLNSGGDVDPIVFWFNTQLMQDYWASHAPATTSLSVLDLEAAATSNDPYADLKKDFALAKELVAATAIELSDVG